MWKLTAMDNGKITYQERDMTQDELAAMNQGFEVHGNEHGNPPEEAERFGFVLHVGEEFIGCSSGLAYKFDGTYSPWFYLTDLYVDPAYRGYGHGAELLKRVEERVQKQGLTHSYTWTAGYEAPGFYKGQGYEVFVELDNYYVSGHARVGLRKKLV